MPAIFGSLTAIVLALSAWIAFKNNAEYKKQIIYRQNEEKAYAKEVENFNEITDAWEAAVIDKDIYTKQNEVLEGELKTLEDSVAKIAEDVASDKSIKATLDEEISEAQAELDKVGGAEKLIPKVEGLQNDIVDLTQQIEDGNAELSNLKQVKADTEAVIALNEQRVENETAGRSQPSLNTSIKTVYSSWGFVTLNGGDVQGVVPGSTLEVVRGGETLAQLKVTTVEANKAAADIVRESVGPDVYLRAGDKVRAVVVAKPAEPAKPKVAQPAEVTANQF